LIVRGTVADNGPIKAVLVSGAAARVEADGQWEVELPRASGGATQLEARSQDAAGNIEHLPHVVVWP
jgi:hypothetical protein